MTVIRRIKNLNNQEILDLRNDAIEIEEDLKEQLAKEPRKYDQLNPLIKHWNKEATKYNDLLVDED